MIAIPVQVGKRRILILILEQENLVRLQHADPIDLRTDDYFVAQVNSAGIELVIAYEADKEKLVEMAKDGSWADVIKYIERGRTVYDGEVKLPESIL